MTNASVKRRNGTVVPFDGNKIKIAVGKALAATQCTHNDAVLDDILEAVVNSLRLSAQQPYPIELIQDLVENTLIHFGFIETAKAYIRYRFEHTKLRESAVTSSDVICTLNDNKRVDVNFVKSIYTVAINLLKASQPKSDHNAIDIERLVVEFKRASFDGMTVEDVDQVLLAAPRGFIERDPAYSDLCATVLDMKIRLETENRGNLIDYFVDSPKSGETDYQKFATYLKYGVNKEGILHPSLLWYLDNNTALWDFYNGISQNNDISASPVMGLDYLGLQTLYDRYLVRSRTTGRVIENTWMMFARIALAIALNEKEADRVRHAIDFFNIMFNKEYMPSTPTLFNSGLIHQQLSSCYGGTIDDDLKSIYDSYTDCALLSKFSGGIGQDWTNVRALGSYIKGTNGRSQGTIPFMKVLNDTAVAVNQGGKRRGAICSYLETWHLDIEEFLELRKNTGDDRRRTHDMNTANWIPDLFMMRVINDEEWTLFSPNDVPDLHDLYGEAFYDRYTQYEQMAKEGKIKLYKTVSAKALWRKMLGMLFETGHPWITFKDPMNIRNPQAHYGVIHSSNLCTEIALVNNFEETFVCNLGSINLANILKTSYEGKLNKYSDVVDLVKEMTPHINRVTKIAVRMLDNVIDLNYYPIPQAKKSNMLHRPIGLGMMGLQDLYYQAGLPFDSEFASLLSEMVTGSIALAAWEASHDLAMEKGSYETFEGSDWSKGILPRDTYGRLYTYRAKICRVHLNPPSGFGSDYTPPYPSDKSYHYFEKRCNEVASKVAKGMRNCTLMAVAPTATIANIVGVTPSIEPTYKNLYVKSNLSGEFTVINRYLVEDLKRLNLWNDKIISDLKYFDGDLTLIEEIPQSLKNKYATSFDIDPKEMIEQAALRQIWIDQAQSLNLYVANASGKLLDEIYKYAWVSGLKTTYYLRSISKSTVEKSTGNGGDLNAVKVCSIDNPDCEACQ